MKKIDGRVRVSDIVCGGGAAHVFALLTQVTPCVTNIPREYKCLVHFTWIKSRPGFCNFFFFEFLCGKVGSIRATWRDRVCIFLLPLIHGDEGEVESMFTLKHALLVRQFQQTRRSERSADGEQGQRRLFHLAVLSVKDLYTTPDVQSLCVTKWTIKQNKKKKKLTKEIPSEIEKWQSNPL